MADTLKYVVVQNVVNALELEELILTNLGYFNDYNDAEKKCIELMKDYTEKEIDYFVDEYGVEQFGVIPLGINREVLKRLKENV